METWFRRDWETHYLDWQVFHLTNEPLLLGLPVKGYFFVLIYWLPVTHSQTIISHMGDLWEGHTRMWPGVSFPDGWPCSHSHSIHSSCWGYVKPTRGRGWQVAQPTLKRGILERNHVPFIQQIVERKSKYGYLNFVQTGPKKKVLRCFLYAISREAKCLFVQCNQESYVFNYYHQKWGERKSSLWWIIIII